MSVEAFTRALNAKVGGGTRKLVLLAYANHADREGRHAWPALATVADYAECDVRTAQRAVKALVRDGWLRRGDQEIVAHRRGDRRPVVYDVAMDDGIRALWAADERTTADTTGGESPARQDNLSPRHESTPVDNHGARQDNLSPRPEAHGVTPEAPRGDTAVSYEPSRTITNPPTPLAAHSCAVHPTGALGCRSCGTTPRQIAAAANRAAEAAKVARRKQAQADAAADRRTPKPRDPAKKKAQHQAVRQQAAVGHQLATARGITR